MHVLYKLCNHISNNFYAVQLKVCMATVDTGHHPSCACHAVKSEGAHSEYGFIIIHSKWYFVNLQDTAASTAEEQKTCIGGSQLDQYLHE